MELVPGLVYEKTWIVTEADTAAAMDGDKFPTVLSTPTLIGWVETTAYEATASLLAEIQGTVGTQVNIRHSAATPVGMKVRIRVELLEVERRRLLFKVEAWDEVEGILSGEHERFIIDRMRFDTSLSEKRSRWQASRG